MKNKYWFFAKFANILIITLSVTACLIPAPLSFAVAAGSINNWWPIAGAQLSGLQPFKANIVGQDVNSYSMYWQVDGGQLNPMSTQTDNGGYKEADVNVSSWNWQPSGNYTITFVAQNPDGSTITTESVPVTLGSSSAAAPSTSTASPVPTPGTSNIASQAQTPSTTLAAAPIVITASPSPEINAWWPTKGAQLSGLQPFKANIVGQDVNSYSMYWQVDGGQMNPMSTHTDNGGYKEADVNVSSWNWQESGNYTITFVAENQSGTAIATQNIPITVNTSAAAPSTAATPAAAVTAPITIQNVTPVTTSVSNGFYVNPNSEAAEQATAWATSNPSGAAAMQKLANQPTAAWITSGTDVESTVAADVNKAAAANTTALLVAYDIPDRDCGGDSSGGAANAGAYESWISSFASGIGNNSADVILEPDALAESSCLSASDQQARFSMLSQAVQILKANPNTKVYIDAGHANWVSAGTMATDLEQAGIQNADGFSLNVSNFDPTATEVSYGQQLSAQLGGKHFVVDTSRNGGNVASGQWCNPSGASIGNVPSTNTGISSVDAYLWVKVPGESDGSCNGGPSAGVWWPSYAESLVTNG